MRFRLLHGSQQEPLFHPVEALGGRFFHTAHGCVGFFKDAVFQKHLWKCVKMMTKWSSDVKCKFRKLDTKQQCSRSIGLHNCGPLCISRAKRFAWQVSTYEAHQVGPLCWPTDKTLAAHLRFVLQARGFRSIDMFLALYHLCIFGSWICIVWIGYVSYIPLPRFLFLRYE